MNAGFGSLLKSGDRVWLSDGVGIGVSACAELSSAARASGSISLVLGWCPILPPGLDLTAFRDVRAIMGGYGLRCSIDDGSVRYLPVRLSNVPALIAGPLAPNVVVVAATEEANGYGYGPEIGWIPAAIESAETVAVIIGRALSSASSMRISKERALVLGESLELPVEISPPEISKESQALAENVARYVKSGVRLQYGPGALGVALLDVLVEEVRIDTGMITDAVLGLDRKGLLMGKPIGTYLAGTLELYDWACGQNLIHRLEYTHSPARLSDGGITAVNTALQIDYRAQVNVERIGSSVVGGIGGHPDYAAAASRHPLGLSIVALLTHHNGVSTLVPQLDVPTTTARHDVDIVATERGTADLRGLSDGEREQLLRDLWGE